MKVNFLIIVLCFLFTGILNAQTSQEVPKQVLQKNFSIGINTNSITKFGLLFAGIPYKERSWYLDIKISGNTPDKSSVYGFSKAKAEEFYNDPLKDKFEVMQIVNFGQTYRFNDYYYFMYGVGITSKETYNKYYDNYQILTPSGDYYLKTDSSTEMNLNIAINITPTDINSPLSLYFGYDLNPGVVSFGLNLNF